MKALSIKQPWARLICTGQKDIENRDWLTEFSGRVYVHASKKLDDTSWEFIKKCLGRKYWITLWDVDFINNLTLGAIIGEVDITGCVEKSNSPWFVGKYGFTLANPVLYDKPIPYRGQLGFFEVNIESEFLK